MRSRHAVVGHWGGGWNEAGIQAWAAALRSQLAAPAVTLGLVFASPQYFEHAADLLEVLRLHARIPVLVGCSGRSLISNGSEVEREPGLVVGLYHLPGATLRAVRLPADAMQEPGEPSEWHRLTGVPSGASRGWLVFADPQSFGGEGWLSGWNLAYPGVATMGGLASGGDEMRTQLYLGGEVFEDGAVAVSVSGEVGLEPLVSQGCTPIGEHWTITGADRNFILSIANRPAYEVLVETWNSLPKPEQQKAQGNLFVGLASDEYREDFHRGDFLVRNLIGADPKQGVLAVGASPRAGQTIQFQRRDPMAATEDLSGLLGAMRERLAGREIYGGCLCACLGRGERLFGKPNHDAGLVQEQLGPIPVAGFFGNGELGPIGGRNFLHGYTAGLGLFVKA